MCGIVTMSFGSFAAIAFAAKHLTVFDDGASAVAPRGDMVALHKGDVEGFVAEWADMILSLPHHEFDIVGESTEVEEVLIAGEHVGNDARGPPDFAVSHQP